MSSEAPCTVRDVHKHPSLYVQIYNIRGRCIRSTYTAITVPNSEDHSFHSATATFQRLVSYSEQQLSILLELYSSQVGNFLFSSFVVQEELPERNSTPASEIRGLVKEF